MSGIAMHQDGSAPGAYYARVPESEKLADDKDDTERSEHLHPVASTSEAANALKLRTINWKKSLVYFGVGSLLVYAFCAWSGHRHDEISQGDGSYEQSSDASSKVPLQTCAPNYASKPKHEPLRNVWSTLSVDEAVAVRKWVLDDARGLNLTEGTNATMSDNSIEIVETFYPPKAAALAYYNGSGPLPIREARVIINFGGLKEPYVRDFVVSPLPVVEGKTAIRPLDEIYHRPIVPYNARALQPHDSVFKVLSIFAKDLGRVTQSLFGGVATGKLNDTLVLGGAGPWSFDGSFRRLWLQFRRNIPGNFLNPLNLWQYVDVSGTDPSEWKVLKVLYNHQLFTSQEEFIEAFDNNTLKIEKVPEVDPLWSARYRKGARRDLDHLAGPRSVSFNGLRFRVDKEKQYVTWMGWSFYLGFTRDMGLSLWNIKFLGDRIIYELSAHEALAQYSGDDPHQATTAWLDRFFGMGSCVYEMMPGYDCPHDAVYLPSTLHLNLGSLKNPRAICVFEKDLDKPISRHRGTAEGETGAIKGYALVVRSIATVGNYDYLFDYTFMLDGSMEVRVSASGYLQGGYWDPTEDQHGTRLQVASMGTLHDHVINFKVDFDVAGTQNSMVEKTTVTREVSYPWMDEDWGETLTQQYIKTRYIETEDEGRLFYPRNLQGAFAVVNQDKKNAWGVPRGYNIIPGISPIFNTVVGSKRMLNNANWAKSNLAVTRRKDTEPSSSSEWNHQLPGAPPVDFDKFFDGESLLQEDIVAWINVGMHHLTQSEDAPTTRTNTATSSFLLSPLNFHDYDVSLDSSNAIMLKVDKDGKWEHNEYGVSPDTCVPPKLQAFNYGSDVLYNEDGKVVDDIPEREPYFRAQAAAHASSFFDYSNSDEL